MDSKRVGMKRFLIGLLLVAIVGAGVLAGCRGGGEGRDSGATETQESAEQGGSESGGEHGSGGESSEGGNEGAGESGASGSEEASGATLAPDETFDAVRAGARLILGYDTESNAFSGTVENTTNSTLTRVRVEVHLSNGTELGPTTPVDLAPGQVMAINLPSTAASFTGWIAHAEVGSGGGEGSQSGGEAGGEHGGSGEGSGGESGESGSESGSESGGEGGGTTPQGSDEIGEAAMSSPTIPLDQTWNGMLGGLAVSARYDASTQSVHTTVQNTLAQVLCYVQAEPHLKAGTRTVGELGPDVMGHLSPGQEATSNIEVASEPNLAGVTFDGYVVHMELFDCGGTGPVPHTGGEGAEGSGGEGSGEGSSESSAAGSEEGSGATLTPDETFDAVRAGARLILRYDAASNAFKGSVENTTNGVLTRVRVEVHLSNGVEIGPTTPVDLAPGETAAIELPSTSASFAGWIAHAEVGGGGEGTQSGGEAGGEHGGSGESGGEHGGSGGSGEHGSGGEGQGGG